MNNFDEKIFLACLDAMDAGEDTETILARYPDQAEAIRQLLAIDDGLAGLPQLAPAGAQARSERTFLTQASAMKSVSMRTSSRSRWWRPLMTAFAALVLILALSLGALQASAGALPGDIFYPVKRLSETTQLRLANGATAKELFIEQIEGERIREVSELMRLGRNENVACSGEIELLALDYVQVYGLRVETNENTIVDGELVPGATAVIEGYTEDGRYYATSITIVASAPSGAPGTTMPQSTGTATVTATATRAATTTREATPTLRATTTAEPTEPSTATVAPAATNTVSPPITATPDDDDDDDCDNSGPGNNCDDDDDECDSSGSGNNCDDDDEDDDPDEDDDDPDEDDGSSNSGSDGGNSGSGDDDDESEDD